MVQSRKRPYKRPYRYYEILEVSKNATQDEIRRAYRKLAKVWHPDVNKDAQATEKFKKINVAYEVLSDQVRRSSYDNSPAECPVCWTHEVIQTTEIHWRCRHCGCKFDLSHASEIIEQVEKAAIPERLRNVVRIFQTTQCSWCRKFYTQPFLCPSGRLRSNCISFDRVGKEERGQLLGDKKWWWRMADMIQQVQERGIMGKCRECGALNPNPQKEVCWHCGKDTLCCPECQKRGQKLILRYDIEGEFWKCSNAGCSRKFAIRPKMRVVEPVLTQDICPKCGKNLYYDATLLLWRCKNCKSVYTQQDLKSQSIRRKASPRASHGEFTAEREARTAKGKESDRSRSGSPFDPDHVGYYRNEYPARRRKSRGLPGWLIAILIIAILAMVGAVVWGLWGSEIADFFSDNSTGSSIEANSTATLSEPSTFSDTSLLIYLDANYTMLWDSTNQPDLSAIDWETDPNQSSSPYSWEQGILTVYLWNTGDRTLEVNAQDNIHAVSPGFSANSDIVTIKPNEHTHLNITIERSVEVWGFTGGSSFSVWFNIRTID